MPPSKKTILVIEDDPSIREALSELLQAEGYSAVVAPHGQDALDILKTANPNPSLMLLDLSMPVMDGATFLQKVQNFPELNSIPILIMTAAGRRSIPDNYNPNLVFLKPLDVSSLMNAIEALA